MGRVQERFQMCSSGHLGMADSVTFPASVCDPRQGISNHEGSPQLWDVAFLLGLNPIWLVWLELDLITWG